VTAPASRISYYLEHRQFAGPLAEADAIGGANVDGRPPGAAIYLQLRESRIANAGYQASGCGYLIACCSAMLELCVGQSPADCSQLSPQALEAHLGELPESKRYCAELAVLALRNALAKLPAASAPSQEEAA
jgi:NifU-like protein involved in Fe-S cluster formation